MRTQMTTKKRRKAARKSRGQYCKRCRGTGVLYARIFRKINRGARRCSVNYYDAGACDRCGGKGRSALGLNV